MKKFAKKMQEFCKKFKNFMIKMVIMQKRKFCEKQMQNFSQNASKILGDIRQFIDLLENTFSTIKIFHLTTQIKSTKG